MGDYIAFRDMELLIFILRDFVQFPKWKLHI